MNTASRLNRVAGWGVAIYMTQTNIGTTDHVTTTTEETSLTKLFGSVETDSKSPFFLGAALHTNNTGELTALGEAIIWLIFNLKQLCTSISTPLKNIVIHSDSNYAINAIIGTESGPSNIQLYSHIRQLLREFKQSLQPYNLAGNGLSSTPIKAPTFSIRKVKAHAGIKGNEKADMLAQMGQHQVCNSGRYLILPQYNLPTNCLHNSSKSFNGVSKLSLNDNSKNLEVTHIAHETSIGEQFSNFCSNLPSLQQELHSSLSSPSSSSTASDPADYPLALKNYD
jgi:ribonuclease HI